MSNFNQPNPEYEDIIEALISKENNNLDIVEWDYELAEALAAEMQDKTMDSYANERELYSDELSEVCSNLI